MTVSNAQIVARSAASAAGATLTPNGEANVVALLETAGRIEPGRPATITVDGVEQSTIDWVRGLVSETPAYFQPVAGKPEAAASAPQGETMTAKAIRVNSLARAGRDAAARARAEAIVAKHGNPFRSGNLTHQHVVKSGAPDLAARLKQEASK